MNVYAVLATIFISSNVLSQTVDPSSGPTSTVDVRKPLPGCPAALGDGLADDSVAFQCHATYLSNIGNEYRGGILNVPAGTYYFGATVSIPKSVSVIGVGEGSVISQKPSYKGVMIKLGVASRLKHIKFTQEQPSLPTSDTPWFPYLDYDYQVAIVGARVNVEDIMLLNPLNGILISGENFPQAGTSVGQIYLSNIRGQPLLNGIVIDGALDIIRISDVHFWPFWSINNSVRQYVQLNGYAIRSYRNDNPFFTNIFTFGYFSGFHFGKSPAGDRPPVTGITSRARIKGYDCDSCVRGIFIDGDGTNGILVNEAQILGAEPNSYPSVHIVANDVSMSISQLDTTWSSANVVRVEGDRNSVLVSDSIVRTWNRSGLGFPAFEIAEGANNLLQINNTLYGDGHGAIPARAIQGTLNVRDLTHAPYIAR